jgi:hypothetical protein
MKKRLLIILFVLIGVILLLAGQYYLIDTYLCSTDTPTYIKTTPKQNPQAIMLLIEFKNTDGLINMVNDMKERDIKGLLMVDADFVEDNLDDIKAVLTTGLVEIVPTYIPKPYWEMTYDQQYEVISEMVTKIEELLEIKPRIISSRYMGSNEDTVKIAEELGIEYITARGTTELATTIYKPQEYDVKIVSVSNIDVPEFKYGSFCDYSFYERSGSPEDMEREYKRAILNNKFIGVSHTYIGGQKLRWNNMWHNFWDNYNVDWVDLDTLATIDKEMPMWQIPTNINAPYTPEKIRPVIPYDEEENVINPCKVDDLTTENASSQEETDAQSNKLVVFHNNRGTMCLDMLAFFEENNITFEQHLTTDKDFTQLFNTYKDEFAESEGVSTTFGFYPFIFIEGRAFSGFDNDIGTEILNILK